ncbi:hypothetical protein ABZY09_44790 [Streptomyces sp. NPDC002928]|uniref:hypothetical protein n=1 Tax=Streptomyces sp. NPDC002928 TaxID=3154440 RepID=UPI0033BB7575
MTDPQTAAAAAKTAMTAARLVKASANPYVMVKHGRREDRAAAYDRFIAACAASFYDGDMDRDGITELLAALQAVVLRAPKHVRHAANDLFDRIAGNLGFTRGGLWEVEDGSEHSLPPGEGSNGDEPVTPLAEGKVAWWRRLFRKSPAAAGAWPGPIRSSDALLLALDDFTQVARLDVLERWWHKLLIPPIRRWMLGRK